MRLEAPVPAQLESAERCDHRSGDPTQDGAFPKGDFASGGRRRASGIRRRGDFATGMSPRMPRSKQTTGDFASGFRTRRQAAAVIGDFATGMRTTAVAQPAAAADRPGSRSQPAVVRHAA